MYVPPGCVLCLNGTESHDHFFFECEFSSQLWLAFASRVNQALPSRLSEVLLDLSLQQHPRAPGSNILHLLLQVIVYSTWIERNKRMSQPLTVIKASIDWTMRNRLLSFPSVSLSSSSLFEFYFGCIFHPLLTISCLPRFLFFGVL
ncbi:hypothetical protein V5N11_005575 [Cardamine amara subsp. amara]|uniref:Reverse transcriptase zinc-binding domain-containing protein n=1 Tax=Cardamine amara subsp. amara TaxID=228776 RepID=A0ABD1AJK1_CARAN